MDLIQLELLSIEGREKYLGNRGREKREEEGRVRNGIENVFCFDRNSNEKKSGSDNQTICLPSFLLLNVHHNNKNCLSIQYFEREKVRTRT